MDQKIEQINSQLEKMDEDYNEIEREYNVLKEKLELKGREYNKLISERNKIVKQLEREKLKEDAKCKELFFNVHYQKFLNNLDSLVEQSRFSARARFYELLTNMTKFCDHPIVLYGGASKYNPTDLSHFIPLDNAMKTLTDDVDKKCLKLQTEFNNYKLGTFNIWVGGESWYVYCKKCKIVEKRVYETSM